MAGTIQAPVLQGGSWIILPSSRVSFCPQGAAGSNAGKNWEIMAIWLKKSLIEWVFFFRWRKNTAISKQTETEN